MICSFVMARVRIICRNYVGAYQHLNHGHWLDVPRWRFILASLTLGFQRFPDFVQAGPRLWMHRLGLGFSGAAFLGGHEGDLCLTDDHNLLDASEKGAVSYWQGMVFAKLVAAEILSISWLAHADTLERQGQLVRSNHVENRADMAGRDDNERWHVIEAKGYSTHPGTARIAYAKEQAGMVTEVNQSSPETTSGCVTLLWKTPIETVMDDPLPRGKETWKIDDGGFWQYYYSRLAGFVKRAQKTKSSPGHPGFTFAPLSPLVPVLPLTQRPKGWEMPMIGLPDPILKDVTLAPQVVRRLVKNGPLDRVAADGIALIGSLDEWPALRASK